MREEGVRREAWGLREGVLLIGASGMLGRAWAELLRREGIAFEPVGRDRLDFCKPETVSRVVTPEHKIVINCAGFTDVDGAERDEATATQVNGLGVGALAERCKTTGSWLVHYSTDYVFNGRANQPYKVDSPIEPLNAYGRSKALGEKLLRESGCRHLIVRTSWLYAPWGKNFVRTIAKLARERDEVKVVNDQRGRPTSCEHLAAASLKLLGQDRTGTFHVTDGGECTWFDFAREIVRLTGTKCRVTPCTTADFPRPANRPAYSVLDIAATESALGPLPDWKTNLARVVERLELF